MTSRASVLPQHAPRASMYPGGMGAGTGTGAQARLAAKQAELEGLRALRDQSARLAREMARLGERVDVLVDGGDAVANVLTCWHGVFRAIQIARSSVASTQAQAHNEEQDETNDTDPDADQDQDAQAPKLTQHVDLDRIVRVPVGLDPALLDHDS